MRILAIFLTGAVKTNSRPLVLQLAQMLYRVDSNGIGVIVPGILQRGYEKTTKL